MFISLTKRQCEVISKWLGDLRADDIVKVMDKYDIDLEPYEVGETLLDLYWKVMEAKERC